MSFPHLRWALTLVRPLGLFAAVLAGLILAGHALNVEILYRPLSGGPATHPLTAITLGGLGLGLASWRPRRPVRLTLVMACLALVIALLRLLEITSGHDLLGGVTPFLPAASGKPILMGANTALMTATMGLALILDYRRRILGAQLLAFTALAFPLVSITGYAYGIDKFHGQMALTTVLIALPVGFGILCSSAQHGVLRAILSPWVGGRIARTQILLGYLVPVLIGNLLLRVATASTGDLFGLFVVLVSAFIIGLVAFSAMIQDSIDHSRRCAERRLTFAATRDPLTRLPNRRMLLDHADREMERAARNHLPFSVLILDIDHFKTINDSFGHAVGDRVLIRIAELMCDVVRRQDLPARLGGEEFVILLPDTTPDGATQLAEKLRQQIGEERFADIAHPVTVSIGCAGHAPGAKFQHILDRADAALYRAKAAGRNRVEVSFA